MKKIIVILLFMFSFTLAAQRVLTINSGFNFPETNLVESIINEGFTRAQIPLRYQTLPNQRSLLNANNGTDDGEAARILELNSIYPNLIRVNVPIHTIELVVLSMRKLYIKEPADLKHYNVGVIRGMKIAERISEDAKPLSLTKATSHLTLIKMLSSHRLDAIVTSKIILLSSLSETKDKVFYITSKPILSRPLYFHLHKKHKDLIPKFEEAFKSMIDDGTIEKLYSTFLIDLEAKQDKALKVIKDD
ncbi:MAG: transporter substrate-binding domain-containing protein [Sulfurimonas sp.]|nr:transporter substrate-binding domain-containing protein [Sulfurimonas sp.]